MNPPIIQYLADHQTQLWSLGMVIFSALVGRIFQLRPKLRFSVDHATNMLVDQPLMDKDGNQVSANQLVRTASITVQNAGLLPAKAVEVTFNWKPLILNLSPARAFNEEISAFSRYSLKFDSFAPSERVTIDIMSINAELPVITAVRSADCVGKTIKMMPQRVWPQWLLNSLLIVTLLGFVTCVYLAIRVVQIVTH